MNGLEAIELMQQGKMVKRTDIDIKYRINNDRVEGMNHSDIWCEEFLFNVNGDFEEYIEPKTLTGWERVADFDMYYAIYVHGVTDFTDSQCHQDNDSYGIANYFSTKDKAEEVNFKQTLFRKLQRFSDENGGTEIDWNNEDQTKFSIKYSHWSSKLSVDRYNTVRQFGQVYFASKEVARRAIELFHDDLIKYFTM